jgi:hypothetical protein
MNEVTLTLFDEVVQARLMRPKLAAQVAESRLRRPFVGSDGRLFIVAADFAGRGIIGAGSDSLALARRGVLLERLVTALEVGSVDGVLGTADIIDDLYYVEGIRLERGVPSILNERLLIGSINRGGVLGTVYEMDDTDTGHSIAGAIERGLDATKVMIRLDPDDAGSGRTLTRAAETVRASASRNFPIMVEIFPVRRDDAKYASVVDSHELARCAVVASALGDDTSSTWLKVPYCDDFEVVAGSTTLPITILGGDSSSAGNMSDIVVAALAAGSNVRGAVVGRRSLFPPDGNVTAACASVGSVVHTTSPEVM